MPNIATARRVIAKRIQQNAAPDSPPPLDDGDAPQWEEGSAESDSPPMPIRRPLVLKRLLDGEPPRPPKLSIEKFLLAADVNCLGASGDAGKSVTIFTTAVCTVLGRPLFGSLTVKQPGPVVLIVPEDGEAVARHHVDAIVAGMEIGNDERATLVRDLHIVGDDRRFNLLVDTPELAALCRPIRPSLIGFDPIGSLIGGEDENAEHIAEKVCDNIRRYLARPLGSATVIAAHLRKPSRENGASSTPTVHDLKGSAGWANHSRIVWMLSKPKGGNLITYRLEKSNRLPTGLEHQVTLTIEADPDNAAHWFTLRLTDANIGATSQSLTPGIGRAINENERKALSATDDKHEPGLRLSYSAWFRRSGLNAESTFKTIRERLIDAKLVSPIPTGKKTRAGGTEYSYEITTEGRRALDTGWSHA